MPQHSPMTKFQAAVEARDLAALRDALAPDVQLFPPIQFQSFVGRELVARVLRIPTGVFAFHDSFRYVTVLSNGDEHAVVFRSIDRRTSNRWSRLHPNRSRRARV